MALLNKSERSDFMLSDLEITIEKDASLVSLLYYLPINAHFLSYTFNF